MEACCSGGANQRGADATSYCNRIVISFLTGLIFVAGRPNTEVGANSVSWCRDVPISQDQNRVDFLRQSFAESTSKRSSVYQDTAISVFDKTVENAPSILTKNDPELASEKSKDFPSVVFTLKENRNDDVLPSADCHKFVLLLNSDRKTALSSHLVKKRQIYLQKDRRRRAVRARMPAFRKTESNKNGKLYEIKRSLILDLFANRLSRREIKRFINEYKKVLQGDAALKSTISFNDPLACVNSIDKHSEENLQNLLLDRPDPKGKSTTWRQFLNKRLKRNSKYEKGESANDGNVALEIGNSFLSPLTSSKITFKRMLFKPARKNKRNYSLQLVDSKINLSTKVTSRSILINNDLIEATTYSGTTSSINFRHALGNSENTIIINETAEIIRPDYSLNTNSRSSTIPRKNYVTFQNFHLDNDSWTTVRMQAMKVQNVSHATTLKRELRLKFTRNTVIPKIKSKKKLRSSTRINEETNLWNTVVDSAEDESKVTPEMERITSSRVTGIPEMTVEENGSWYGEIPNKLRENVPLTNSIPKILYDNNLSWKIEGMNVSWSADSPGLESEKLSGRTSNPKRITKKHNMSYTALIPMRNFAENSSRVDFKSKSENISWSTVIINESDSQHLSFLIPKNIPHHREEYDVMSAFGTVDKEKAHDPWSTMILNKTYRKQTPSSAPIRQLRNSRTFKKMYKGNFVWNIVIPKKRLRENVSKITVIPEIIDRENVLRNAIKVEPIVRAHFVWNTQTPKKITSGNISWSTGNVQGIVFTRNGFEGNSLSSIVPKKERIKISWNKEIPRRIDGDSENVTWNTESLKKTDNEEDVLRIGTNSEILERDKVTLKVGIPEREIRQDVLESTVFPRRLKAEYFSWSTFIPKIINGDFNPRIYLIPNKVDSGYISRSSIVPTRKDRAVTNSVAAPREKYDKNIVSGTENSRCVSRQHATNNSEVEIVSTSPQAENTSRSSIIPAREPISWSKAILKRINAQNEMNGIVNTTNDIARENSLWSTIVPKIIERENVSWIKQSSNFLIDGTVSKDGIAENGSWWSTVVPKITKRQNMLIKAIPNEIFEKNVIHGIANTTEIDGDNTFESNIMPNTSKTGSVSRSKEIPRRVDIENDVRITGIPKESIRDIIRNATDLGITDRDNVTLNIEIPERKIINQSISSNTVNSKRINLDFSWNTFIPKIINGGNVSWITLIRDIIDIGNISSSPIIPTNTAAIPKRRNRKSKINQNKLHSYTADVSRKVNKQIFTVPESTKSDLPKIRTISQQIRPMIKSTTEKQGKLSSLKMPSMPKRVDRQNPMKTTPLVLRGNHLQEDSFRVEPNVDLLGNFTDKGNQFTSSDINLNTSFSYSNGKTKPTSDSSTNINRKKNSNSISHKSSINWMVTYSSTVSSHDRTENETHTSSYPTENSSEQNAMRPIEKVNALSEDNHVYSYDKSGIVRDENSRNSLKGLNNRGEYRKITGNVQPFQFTGRGITFITHVPPFPVKQQSVTPSREAAIRISSHWRKPMAITKYVYTSNVKYLASLYDLHGCRRLGGDYILLYSPSWRKNKVDYSNHSKIYVTLKAMVNNEMDVNPFQDDIRWRKPSQLCRIYEDATQPYLFYINIHENSTKATTTENSKFLVKRIFKKERSKINTINIQKGIDEKDLYFKSKKDRFGFNMNLMIIVVIRIVQELS